ncbi:MAG: DUF1579 domain-containing protein [Planctomycetes bacterium]|nr:DUF1579 domain-containing protein [Planctomycetota bacterium]
MDHDERHRRIPDAAADRGAPPHPGHGRQFVVSKYETDFMGAPFVGRCTLGYDPLQKCWHSTWIECMSPVLFHLSGNMEGDTLVIRGEAWSCMTNGVAKHSSTNKTISANETIMEMFQSMPNGVEVKTMTMHYKRA